MSIPKPRSAPLITLLLIILLGLTLTGMRFLSRYSSKNQLAIYPGRLSRVTVSFALPPIGSSTATPMLRQALERFLRRPPAALEPPGQISPPTSLILEGSAGLRSLGFDSQFLYAGQPFRAYPLSAELASALSSDLGAFSGTIFGEPVPWSEASLLFPRWATGTIRDLETGLAFRVQRRAGSFHADVQPLTAQDTQIMLGIYGGQWSWARRAALLEVGGRRLAASFHGMPHGAGALRDVNNFPGHFCLHFTESRLHTNGKPDPSHQLMIKKSSGALPEFLQQAEPESLAVTFCEGLRQKDPTIISLASLLPEGQSGRMEEILSQLQDLKLKSLTQPQTGDPCRVSLEADMEIQALGSPQGYPLRVRIECLRPEGWNRWFIMAGPVFEALQQALDQHRK